MSKLNRRLGIAESTIQCSPSQVKELSLHVENPSLEGLNLISPCLDLEAVKSNTSALGGKQVEGN